LITVAIGHFNEYADLPSNGSRHIDAIDNIKDRQGTEVYKGNIQQAYQSEDRDSLHYSKSNTASWTNTVRVKHCLNIG